MRPKSFKILLLFVLCLCAVPSFAQPSDQQLGRHYYNNGEFEKALLYFEKLYNNQPSDFYYKQYFETLLELKEYKEAEKLVKKQSKRYSGKVKYDLDLGEIYERTDEQEKANAVYEKAIKNVPHTYSALVELGEAFKLKGDLDLALRVFEKGKKHVNNYPFAYKTGEIYGKQGNTELMIEEFLDVVVKYSNYMVSIQNSFIRLLDFDDPKSKSTDQLRMALLRRIQKDPDEMMYTEMLIWYFIQIRDFNGAMIQGKAMDKRLKNSNGEDVLILARMCKANREYDVAMKGFNYVIDNYPNGYHYTNARLEAMGTLYEKVTNSSYSQQDLLDLESKYEEILSAAEMGKTSITVPLIMQLAHVEGFYLHNKNKAISLLEEAILIPRISKHHLGECKMALGDMHVLSGNVWDASLYYMQVEKSFKEDVLGHEAKFRNAKIYYYTGQFEWAQAQLDVLKASTSKLISNDAMELSLLITDNLGLDSIAQPMLLFAAADLFIFQNKFSEAMATLDTLDVLYSDHSLSDEILYRRYEIAHKKRNWEACVKYLTVISDNYGEDILGDDATYKLAEIYDYQLKDKDKALEYYKKVFFDYEGSIYVAGARKRYRDLGGNSGADTFKPIILNPEDVEPKPEEKP